MSQLSPCPGCSRHVRVGAATCPFCDVALSGEPVLAPAISRGGRLSRAAMFVAGAALATVAACSDTDDGGAGGAGGGTAGAAGGASGSPGAGGAVGGTTGAAGSLGGAIAIYSAPFPPNG